MADAPEYDISKIRNLGIIAHIDAGKTTTTEHLLYYAGSKHKLGTVDDGNTETDYDTEEQNRGITIYSSCVPLKWQDCTINLIDTPGHVDFTAEVERSLRVLDGCCVVFDAQKGVEAQSETVWRQANKYNVPRMVFINKMDVVGANYANVLEDVKDRLKGKPLSLVIPIGAGSSKDSTTPFVGIIDLLAMKALYFDPQDKGRTIRTEEIPADCLAEAWDYRAKLLDAVTLVDDTLSDAALMEAEEQTVHITAETIRPIIRQLTLSREIQPVLCGSGREHVGIQPLLDAVCWYLPSPLDRPPVTGTHPTKQDKVEKRKSDISEPFSGLVFKVIAGDHGDLFYIRIYSGKLKMNSRVTNAGKEKKEVIGKLFHVHADPKAERDELTEALAGDIIATMGLKDSVTGDTLCDTQHPILLEPITFAEAVVSQSVEPMSSADKDKLLEVVARLMREDPTFIVKNNPETGQLLMSGMGTLHLEVKRNKMERDFRLKVRVGKPLVSYRETLRSPIRVTGECIRAMPQNMFARLVVEFTNERTEPPIQVRSRIKPGILPDQFVAAAERGLKGALQSGRLGYPLLNVQALIIGGEMTQEASSEVAFEAAASDAVQRALSETNLLLLEPILRVDVNAPVEALGAVQTDLIKRGASIENTEYNDKIAIIQAFSPLAKMFNYADELRSLTQGRAAATLTPSHYDAAPDSVLRLMLDPDGV